MENIQVTNEVVESKSPNTLIRELMSQGLTLSQAREQVFSTNLSIKKEDNIVEDALQDFPDDKYCADFFAKFSELKSMDLSNEPVDVSNLMTIISDLLEPSLSMKIDDSRGKYAEIIFGLFKFGKKTWQSYNELFIFWSRLRQMPHRKAKGPGGKGTSEAYKVVVRGFNRCLTIVKQLIKHDDILLDTCKTIARAIMMIPSAELHEIVVPAVDKHHRPIGSCVVWTDRTPSFSKKVPGLTEVPGAGQENYDGTIIEKAMKHRPCTIACPDTCDFENRKSLKKGIDHELHNRREALFACLNAIQMTRPSDIKHVRNHHGFATRYKDGKHNSLDIELYFKRQNEFATINASHSRVRQLLVTHMTRLPEIQTVVHTLNAGNGNLYDVQELRYYYPFYLAVISRIENLCKLSTYTLKQRIITCCNDRCKTPIMYDKIRNQSTPVVCTFCNTHNCGDCGTAYHGNSPCNEVDDEMREIMSSSSVKACPNCGNMADRGTGCRHITCGSCHCHYCWDCDLVLENGETAVWEHMRQVHGGDYNII